MSNFTCTWKPALKGALFAALAGSACVVSAQIATAPPVVTRPIIGTVTPDPNGWGEIGLVNEATYPFDATPSSALKRAPLGPTSKTLFQSPEGEPGSTLPVGQLIHMEYQPTWSMKEWPAGMPPHFHQFYEWGYTMRGDSIMPEPVSTEQLNGLNYRKTEGGWLTRPPYSLHSGSVLSGGERNQLPYELIIFEEGDGHIITVGRDGKPGQVRTRDGGPLPPGIDGDYRNVKDFTRPWLINPRSEDWEPDREVPGRFVKWLDDSLQGGFRSRLVKIPPGWTAPEGWTRTYFEHANVLRYMVWGDMKVWRFKDPQDVGKAFLVSRNYFIYQPPRAIWGYGSGPVTKDGAIWLEVTYAKGLKHGGGPIEAVKHLK
ncbi:MAG: hypothetical protein ABI247_01280 [Rhodanobacter sp.]